MSDNPATTATTGATSPPNSPPNVDASVTPAPAHDNNVIIAAEDVTDDDGISVSHQSLASSTVSLSNSIYDFRVENGRTYHAYRDGSKSTHSSSHMYEEALAPKKKLTNKAYVGPNDEQELDRLDLQHNLFVRSFDGRLGNATPNYPGSKVGRVLDVGTGSGIWAIDFGEEHPEARVIGIDLSPPRTVFVPPNVQFEIDDIEQPWNFSQKFDYIHSRMMTGAIRNWKKYIQRCFKNLAPGGYLELNEGDITPHSDDGTLSPDCSLIKAVRLLSEALVVLGSPYEDLTRLEGVMKEVGFEDVQVKRFKWPTNSWPKDLKYKELGSWNYENVSPNWEGFLMAPLTRALEWTKEEILILAMEARKDCGNRNIHAYFQMYSIYGRKPLKTEEANPSMPTTTAD